MSETLVRTAVTERASIAARGQGIVGFEPNPEDIAKMLEITNRTDVLLGDIAIIGKNRIRAEHTSTPLYGAHDLTTEQKVLTKRDHDALDIRIPISTDQPIHEAFLAGQLAGRLLAPARARNDTRRCVPGIVFTSAGIPTLAITAPLVDHVKDASLEAAPELWFMGGAGVITLAVGSVLMRAYWNAGNRLDMTVYGAAPVLRPIIVHRKTRQR